MNWTREKNARNAWISGLGRTCRGLGGYSRESRRGRKRFKRVERVSRTGKSGQGFERRDGRDRGGRGKHKHGRRDCGPIGILTTRHAASCRAGHFVAAIHRVFMIGGCLRVVMPVNWALGAGGATDLRIGSPGGCAERGIEEDDGNETERCEKRAAAVLVLNHPSLSQTA